MSCVMCHMSRVKCHISPTKKYKYIIVVYLLSFYGSLFVKVITKLWHLIILITNLILESLAPSSVSRACQPCQLYSSIPGKLTNINLYGIFVAYADTYLISVNNIILHIKISLVLFCPKHIMNLPWNETLLKEIWFLWKHISGFSVVQVFSVKNHEISHSRTQLSVTIIWCFIAFRECFGKEGSKGFLNMQ